MVDASLGGASKISDFEPQVSPATAVVRFQMASDTLGHQFFVASAQYRPLESRVMTRVSAVEGWCLAPPLTVG